MRKANLHCEKCPGRKQSVFCELEGETLKYLDDYKNDNLYKKGQNLFIEGNPPFGLFCVHSGKVKITKTNNEGKETIVRIVGAGDILGHRSLFSDAPYAASATMIEDGLVCFVGRPTITELMKKDTSISMNIINTLSQQMGAAEEKMASLARKNLRERFAETLLLLKTHFGIDEDERIRLDIRLTREELASMVGCAPENIMRLMTEFKSDEMILEIKKTIYILDTSALESAAGLDII